MFSCQLRKTLYPILLKTCLRHCILYTQLDNLFLCILFEKFTSFLLLCYRVCFIKKWTTEIAQVWEGIANKLEKLEYPKIKVEQRSVRDRFKKLIKQFRKKENNE